MFNYKPIMSNHCASYTFISIKSLHFAINLILKYSKIPVIWADYVEGGRAGSGCTWSGGPWRQPHVEW